MQMNQGNLYSIRRARPQELCALPEIERAAATQFRSTAYAHMADAKLASEHVDLAQAHVWVVADGHDRAVGFAIVHLLDQSAHLHELDVHPAHARQGLGRRLIETITDWARAQGLTAVTLTTFADIPWNAPYYTRLGFRILGESEQVPALRSILQAEAAAGLPMSSRVCMQLDADAS